MSPNILYRLLHIVESLPLTSASHSVLLQSTSECTIYGPLASSNNHGLDGSPLIFSTFFFFIGHPTLTQRNIDFFSRLKPGQSLYGVAMHNVFLNWEQTALSESSSSLRTALKGWKWVTKFYIYGLYCLPYEQRRISQSHSLQFWMFSDKLSGSTMNSDLWDEAQSKLTDLLVHITLAREILCFDWVERRHYFFLLQMASEQGRTCWILQESNTDISAREFVCPAF